MGTIYNVPVTWVRDSSQPAYKEAYIGTIGLKYSAGNTINATWGTLAGSGITKYDEMTVYWNYLHVTGTLTQGGVTKSVEDHRSGRYYPNGQTYSYSLNFAAPLVQASTYKVSMLDTQSMFNTNTMTRPATIPLDVSSITVERVRNINVVGNKIYEDIAVNFELTSDNAVTYSVKQAGVEVMNGNVSGRKLIIPKGTLKTKDTVTVEFTTSFTFVGTKLTSDVVRQTISGLQELVAEKPANVRLVGTQKSIEENITFAWDTTDADCRATTEIWQDGAKVTDQSNIANKQYILRAGTLKSTGAIKVRVKNTLVKNGYTAGSTYTELSVNDLVSVKPVVSDFKVKSTNADHPVEVDITATNAQKYALYVNNDLVVETESKTITIPPGRLTKGNNTIKAVALRTSSAGVLKGELSKTVSFTIDEPLIYAVEPSNINVNIDELVLVSFSTNTFIDRWDLHLNNSLFRSGTTERQVPVSSGIFKAGLNKVKVTAYYAPAHNANEVRTTTKEVTFTGFGKPQKPVFDANIIYATATPTFTWTTGTTENDAQTAFEIEVHKEHKTVNSTEPHYTVSNPLENSKDYLVRVRIKNKFEMWSEWIEKEFKTVFSQLPKPTITLSPQKENVLIQIECEENPKIRQTVIYRSIDRENWIDIANDLLPTDTLIDFMVGSATETFYKARIYDNAGGYTDSEVKSVKINLMNYNLLNVQHLKSNKRLDFVAINFKNNFTSITKIFAGATKPTFYKSKSNFLTATMTVKLVNDEVNDFIQYLNEGDIFCYRDYKGKKIFVSIDIMAINYINQFMQEIVLKLTEVNFNERLTGNKSRYKQIVYLDGAYYLDGAVDLSSWGRDL